MWRALSDVIRTRLNIKAAEAARAAAPFGAPPSGALPPVGPGLGMGALPGGLGPAPAGWASAGDGNGGLPSAMRPWMGGVDGTVYGLLLAPVPAPAGARLRAGAFL